MNNTQRTRAEWVARYRELGRALANELQSDRDADALRRERDQVSAKIAEIDRARKFEDFEINRA